MFKFFRLKLTTCVTLFAAWTMLLCGAGVLCAQSKDLPMGKGNPTKPAGRKNARREQATTRSISKLEKFPAAVVKAPIENESDAQQIAVYQALSEKDPHNPSTWASFAYVYYKARRYEESVSLYRRAIELKATAAWCYQLGHALSSLGRHGEAIEAFSQALTLDPRFDIARYGLALCYYKIGDPRSAAKQAEILGSFNSQMADSLRRDLKSGRIK